MLGQISPIHGQIPSHGNCAYDGNCAFYPALLVEVRSNPKKEPSRQSTNEEIVASTVRSPSRYDKRERQRGEIRRDSPKPDVNRREGEGREPSRLYEARCESTREPSRQSTDERRRGREKKREEPSRQWPNDETKRTLSTVERLARVEKRERRQEQQLSRQSVGQPCLLPTTLI